jgi:MFS family permease
VSIHRRPGRRVPRPLTAFRGLLAEFPRVVLVLASGDLVASFGFSLFFPFLTIYLVQELGASAAQAGLVVAAYSLFSTVSGIAGGWLADRIGRRPVLIGSISLTALLVTSMAFATEAWHVGVVMVLLGCVDPAFLPAARAAVADTVDEANRPRAFGLLGVANALGWIAGPVIGAGLSSFGYPLLFGLSGLLVGTYTVIAFRWLPETRPAPVQRPSGSEGDGAAVAAVAADAAEAGAASSAPAHAEGRRRRRVFAAFLPLYGMTHALTFLWVTTLPIHAAVGLGLPTTLWGVLFGLNGLLIVLFQLRIATACERRSKPRIMGLAVVLYAAGMGIVALLSPTTAVLGLAVTICLVTLGEMLLMPVVPSFVAELSPEAMRGTYQGIALAAGSLGAGIGPPVAGLVLDLAPGPVLWSGAAAILLGIAVCFLGLGRMADHLALGADPVVSAGNVSLDVR